MKSANDIRTYALETCFCWTKTLGRERVTAFFPPLRPDFGPKPARLRPAPLGAFGLTFSTHSQYARRSRDPRQRRGKATPMPINFEAYRAAAKAVGVDKDYTDAELLQLFAIMETLAAKALRKTSPQLIAPGAAAKGAIGCANDVHLSQTKEEDTE